METDLQLAKVDSLGPTLQIKSHHTIWITGIQLYFIKFRGTSVRRCCSSTARWDCPTTHFNRSRSGYVCIYMNDQWLPPVTATYIPLLYTFTWINVQHKIMVIMCTNQANWMLQSNGWCVFNPLHNQFTFGDPFPRSWFKGVDFLPCDLKHKIYTDTGHCWLLHDCLVQFCNQKNSTTTCHHTLTLGW